MKIKDELGILSIEKIDTDLVKNRLCNLNLQRLNWCNYIIQIFFMIFEVR